MKEKATGEVNLENLDPRVAKSMVHFMYTGKIPLIDGIAKELLAAADFYQVEQLKNFCEEKLLRAK